VRGWGRARPRRTSAHDPARLLAPGGAPPVEDERLLHAHQRAAAAAADLVVLAGGHLVAGRRGAVGALDRRVLAVAEAVEVPLLPHLRLYSRGVVGGPGAQSTVAARNGSEKGK
jgi:hypothetical protein